MTVTMLWLVVVILAVLVVGLLCAIGDQEGRLAELERRAEVGQEPAKR